MATHKADTNYSYKRGKGNASGSKVRTTFVVNGKSESAVMAAIKKKHHDHPGIEIIINSITWK